MSEIITNSYTHAVAQNHFDNGKKYYYRIVDGQIQYKIDQSDWYLMNGPSQGGHIKRIAADNNRLFVMTSDNKLYWRCMVEDWASWVVFVLVALEIAAQNGGVIDDILWLFVGGDYTIEGESYLDFASYFHAYRMRTITSHDRRWNLLDRGIASDEVIDIAVGNWNNSVATYYVLLNSGKILYIDEEPIIKEWFEVKGDNKPTLDENSRICASHSVVAVTAGRKIHWIRIDAHNPDTCPFFAEINYTEVWHDIPNHKKVNHPGWHSIESPASQIDEFFIDVGCGAPWPIPGTDKSNPLTSLFYNIVKAFSEEIDEYRETHTECGIFGYIDPNDSRYNYPLCCVIKNGHDGTYKHALVPRPRSKAGLVSPPIWEDVEINPCLSFVGNVNTKEVHTLLCSRGNTMLRSHRRLYGTLEEAFADGYDGCFYCLRQYSER